MKINLPITNGKENEFLQINVSHRDGGINYFSYKTEPKGVEVSFTRVVIVNRDGFTSTSYTPMDGENFRILAHEYKRKSQKRIDAVYNFVKDNKDWFYDLWINKNKKEIAEILWNQEF